ncbi:hypothetical protein JVU11DRAFT_10787 [Chiua virens]|nr:hypothetical protein JVU11DRAFT_10787 [Chiua virens]
MPPSEGLGNFVRIAIPLKDPEASYTFVHMCPQYPGVMLTIEIVSSPVTSSTATKPKDLVTTPKAKSAKVVGLRMRDEDKENYNKTLVADPPLFVSPLVSPGQGPNNLKRLREVDPNDESLTEPESEDNKPKFFPSHSTTSKKAPKYERPSSSWSNRK